MLKKIIFIVSSLYCCAVSGNQQNEFRRQYDSYVKQFNKVETEHSFQIFLTNLNEIDIYNKENSNCKMYLTQHSDTFDNQYLLRRCRK